MLPHHVTYNKKWVFILLTFNMFHYLHDDEREDDARTFRDGHELTFIYKNWVGVFLFIIHVDIFLLNRSPETMPAPGYFLSGQRKPGYWGVSRGKKVD